MYNDSFIAKNYNHIFDNIHYEIYTSISLYVVGSSDEGSSDEGSSNEGSFLTNSFLGTDFLIINFGGDSLSLSLSLSKPCLALSHISIVSLTMSQKYSL